jgi:hypothetical protein
MGSNARRKEYLYPMKHRDATIMGVISIAMHPLKCDVSEIAHGALVI